MTKPVKPVSYTGAQRRASDPSLSVWVNASAGTGKTHVLVARALRLLLRGSAPERILCITYTNAAAEEMRRRLTETLRLWSLISEEALREEIANLQGRAPSAATLSEARRIFPRLMRSADGVRIQTIHSFCAYLLHRFPLEAGLPPSFRQMDEAEAHALSRKIGREILKEAERQNLLPSEARRILALHISPALFDEWLDVLMTERGELEEIVKGGGLEETRRLLRETLGLGEGETEREILASVDNLPKSAAENLKKAAAIFQKGGVSERKRGEALAAFLKNLKNLAKGEAEETRENYIGVFLTPSQGFAPRVKLANKETAERHPRTIAFLEEERKRVHALFHRARNARDAALTESLLLFARHFYQRLRDRKRFRGLADFDDLIHFAADLLEKPDIAPWIRYKLDGGIDHILLDEAQDTSPDQWRVIRALSDEFFVGEGAREAEKISRTLFVVGDGKQSIFSFQGADLETFHAMRAFFGTRARQAGARWEEIQMTLSFRSSPGVLRAIDKVFALPETRAGLGEEVRHQAHDAAKPALIEQWRVLQEPKSEEISPFDAEEEGEKTIEAAAPAPARPALHPLEAARSEERLAKRIASEIAARVKEKRLLPGDILILMRKRAALYQHLLRALKERDLELSGADRFPLASHAAVMDLLALASFALLPEDDLNLAIVLKSPFIGFGEEDLMALLPHRGQKSLWETLQKRADEKSSWREARLFLQHALARADFVPPFEFFHEILTLHRGREKLLRKLGRDAETPIEIFLNMALLYERDHTPSLQDFSRWLASDVPPVKRGTEKDSQKLRLMTVHGAKGLEAPVVYLPDTCSPPSHLELASPLFLESAGERGGGGGRIPFWSSERALEPAIAKEAREKRREKARQEYHRLLYVALTRAKEEIHVCGRKGKNRQEGGWHDLILSAWREGLRPTEDAMRFRFLPEPAETPAAEPAAPAAETPAAETAASLPKWALTPFAIESASETRFTPSASEDTPLSPLKFLDEKADSSRARGVHIHHLLHHLPSLPKEARKAAAERYLDFRAADFSQEARRAMRQSAIAILEEEVFARFFAENDGACRREAAIAGYLRREDGTSLFLSGRMDLLRLPDKGAIEIVDFKTGGAGGGGGGGKMKTPESYLRQMAFYRSLMQDRHPDRQILCALLWTDAPRLENLSASALKIDAFLR